MAVTVEADTSTIVMAPMPGMLKSVEIEVGQEVSNWGWGKGGEGSKTAQSLAFMPETVEADTSTIVMAPMPGMLKSVDIEVGHEVSYWGWGKGGEGSKTAQLLAFMPERVEADTSTIVMAPMPGMLKSVDVEVGQEVSYWG